MKKNLWILLALSALIAMFVISGCQKAVTPTPTPTPTPTATVAPTAAPDTAAPKVVSTDVYKYYGALPYDCTGCNVCPTPLILPTVSNTLYTNCDCGTLIKPKPDSSLVKPLASPNFKIVITFDENIDELVSSCLYNPANWTVKVKNTGRIDREITNLPTETDVDGKKGNVFIQSVVVDGKKIIVSAAIEEYGTLTLHPTYDTSVTNDYIFCGLICSTNDATAYAKVINGPYYGFSFAKAAPTVADEICWVLSSTCVISDELGNVNCGYNDCDCCLEATCESCEEGCPFGEPVCPACVNPCE